MEMEIVQAQNLPAQDSLVREVVDLVVDAVNLRHKDKSQITGETELVGKGLGLDSLDILEIVVAIEKKFGIQIGGADEGKQIFQTIGTLADFVQRKTQAKLDATN